MARLIAPRVRPGAEDFGTLFPEFSVSAFSGVRYNCHEYTIIEGTRLSDRARVALDNNSKGDSVGLVHVLADNCGHDQLEIAGLEDEDWAALIKAFEQANNKWLSKDIPKPGTKTERWSSIVQDLVSHGHTFDKICGYTLRQVYLFYGAIDRLSSRGRARRIVDVSLGFNGGDEAKDALKTLQRASE